MANEITPTKFDVTAPGMCFDFCCVGVLGLASSNASWIKDF